MNEIHVWTDGSSIQGCAGYACVFESGEIFAGNLWGTNQQAEMMAIELAIMMAQDGAFLAIHTDSSFAIKAITRGWNLSKSPHLEEIRGRIREDFLKRKVHGRFVKVKGHSGDKFNDLADRLARQQAERLRYS
jgi:ribonuclease HI